MSDSGIEVNPIAVAAVWQAVNRIGGDVGSLPLVLYERKDEKDRERAKRHPAYRLVRRRSSVLYAASKLREIMQAQTLLWGNSYAIINRDSRGNPVSLFLLDPELTEPRLIEGELWYLTTLIERDSRGVETKRTDMVFRAIDVLHIPGLGFDGIKGVSVISIARNSWGLGLAGERHGSRFFRNNARPGIVLQAPVTARFKPEDARKLMVDWNAMHQGVEHSNRTALLQQGIEAKVIQMSNEDSQWIELRKHQRVDVASWFNLPPHMVGDESRTSFKSLESENASYLNQTLKRWLVVWEDECNEKLLTEVEKRDDSHFFEFLTADLLRTDTKGRYETYEIGIRSHIILPNEARAMENMNAIDGGDEFPPVAGAAVANPASGGEENPATTEQLDETEARLAAFIIGSHNTSETRFKQAEERDQKASESAAKLGRDEHVVTRQFFDKGFRVSGNALTARRVLSGYFRYLIGVESNNVCKKAKTPAGFVRKVEEYYDAWQGTMRRTIDDMGGNPGLADLHCRQSIDELLAIAVDSKTLTADVAAVVGQWPLRADSLVASILGENTNGAEKDAADRVRDKS